MKGFASKLKGVGGDALSKSRDAAGAPVSSRATRSSVSAALRSSPFSPYKMFPVKVVVVVLGPYDPGPDPELEPPDLGVVQHGRPPRRSADLEIITRAINS